MKLRTRLAVMVVLALIGCVFAAPYYRTSNPETVRIDESEPSLPTLQIRRIPTEPYVDVIDVPPNLQPDPASPSTNRSTNRFVSSSVDDDIRPIAAISLPPPLEVHRTALQSVAGREHIVDQQRLKPVSLIGTSIGSDATPNMRTQTRAPHPAAGQKLQPVNRVERAEPAEREDPKVGMTSVKPERWHRIVNGDTLQELAREYFGTPAKALAIFEANRNVLVSPAILPIGTELVIPHLSPTHLPARQQVGLEGPRDVDPEGRPGWQRANAGANNGTDRRRGW